MPRINLISERRKREKRQVSAARFLLAGCYFTAAILFATGFYSKVQIYRKQADIEQAKGQYRAIQPTLDEVTSVQSQIALLEPKIKLLGTAKDSTLHWYLTYQQVGQALPRTTWLDQMDIDKDAKTGSELVDLSGQSLSQDTVATTIEALQNYPAFGAVTLDSINQQSKQVQGQPGIHPVRFEMKVELKNTPQAQSKSAPGQTPGTPSTAGAAPGSAAPGSATPGSAAPGSPAAGSPSPANPALSPGTNPSLHPSAVPGAGQGVNPVKAGTPRPQAQALRTARAVTANTPAANKQDARQNAQGA